VPRATLTLAYAPADRIIGHPTFHNKHSTRSATDRGQVGRSAALKESRYEQLILARTEAGIAKAREQGKQFGRPERLDAGQKRKIAERVAKGDASMADLAAEYGVGVATIWRAVQPEIVAA
jgi:putative DNA-invertase from lambdoid prophage Rac